MRPKLLQNIANNLDNPAGVSTTPLLVILEVRLLPCAQPDGVGIHGVSVLLEYRLFGKEWEERKIKEIMDKERKAG
jgi:hypothetical protein